MDEKRKIINTNLASVRQRIHEAAERAGRSPSEVTLLAVTKYVTSDIARILLELGCRHFGESRPQQIWEKVEQVENPEIQWHLIGHLQRNKARRTLPLVSMIESVDSARLLHTLDRETQRTDSRARLLLEVNISGDREKYGLAPDEAVDLTHELDTWPHVEIVGLMAMSARSSDAQTARRDFIRLRQLRDHMQLTCPESVRLKHLSMGMSRDFETAIEEGATIVRIGSALFRGLL